MILSVNRYLSVPVEVGSDLFGCCSCLWRWAGDSLYFWELAWTPAIDGKEIIKNVSPWDYSGRRGKGAVLKTIDRRCIERSLPGSKRAVSTQYGLTPHDYGQGLQASFPNRFCRPSFIREHLDEPAIWELVKFVSFWHFYPNEAVWLFGIACPSGRFSRLVLSGYTERYCFWFGVCLGD